MALVVPLTDHQASSLFEFFVARPRLLHHEHFFHRRSPLDNLEHYLWEEFNEDGHANIRRNYIQNGALTDQMLVEWMNQELAEHNYMND